MKSSDHSGAPKLHPSVESMLSLFHFQKMPEHIQQQIDDVRRECAQLAEHFAYTLPNNPATTRGLTRLWEAKNELVAAIILEAKSGR